MLGDDSVKAELLSELKYLDLVIRETLRLFPIAPLMVRQVKGDIKLGKLYFSQIEAWICSKL